MEHAEILHRCFRCGYCKLPGNYADFNCPAYVAFRFETYSPGGRMWLLRAWLDHKLEPSRRFQEIMYACTACGNCVEQCALTKLKDEILAAITAGKGALVDEGKVPPPVRDCLTNLQKYGNPYGLAQKKRTDWAAGANIDAFSDQEYLFFAGDVGAFDTRGREIAVAVAALLTRMGVSFGIMGNEAVSDGNEANSMGESELFRLLAEKNIDGFSRRKVKKIITLSPHSFNALKNDYPVLGGTYQVLHYTQVLAEKVGSLAFRDDLPPLPVTYHDPCYLGRHNREYWAARKVLAGVPGIEVREMDRVRQDAFCCGGGGGNVFTGILENGPESPARSRVAEALATGARILAVSCPTCAVMLGDAVVSNNADDRIQVQDIAEIVTARLGD